jgi:hypothetical protein
MNARCCHQYRLAVDRKRRYSFALSQVNSKHFKYFPFLMHTRGSVHLKPTLFDYPRDFRTIETAQLLL